MSRTYGQEFIRSRPSYRQTIKVEALQRNILEGFKSIVKLSKEIPEEILTAAMNINEPSVLADFIASNMEMKLEDRRKILGENEDIPSEVAEYAKKIKKAQMPKEAHTIAENELDGAAAGVAFAPMLGRVENGARGLLPRLIYKNEC